MALQHAEWIVIRAVQRQIAVFSIALQPTLPFQVAADPARYGMRQLREFATGGFIDPVETGACSIGASEVDTVLAWTGSDSSKANRQVEMRFIIQCP